LQNYYEILGLRPGAGILEIKTAFRQLAKLYHPDKNPEGKEHFENILKAYETLSDPLLKTSYDYRLFNHSSSNPEPFKKATNSKQWRFDERELKRRQYYNEHIKKYAKKTAADFSQAATEKTYNEFKYILFATPLAVILFILIMKMASGDAVKTPEALPTSDSGHRKESVVKDSVLYTGDAPYTGFFGTPIYDTISNCRLNVKNETGADVIFCLFSEADFIRSVYLPVNYSTTVVQLPFDTLYLRYSSGEHYDPQLELKYQGIYGAFSMNRDYFKKIKPVLPKSIKVFTIELTHNKGAYANIQEKDFFSKTY
jgi:hypothetical protein